MSKGAEEDRSIRNAIKQIEKNIFRAEDVLGINQTPVEEKTPESSLTLDYIQNELYRLNGRLTMVVAELDKVR